LAVGSHTGGRIGGRDPRREAGDDHGKLSIDHGGVIRKVVAEQRLGHDPQRDPHHVGAGIDRGAACRGPLPVIGRLGRQPRDDRGEVADALARERRLRYPPLPLPERAAARDQAVAEHHA
jgi:hypothetical protein